MGERIIIIGAGQAGLQIAESLRAEGFNGEILLLGEEGVAPYQRPSAVESLARRRAASERLTLRGPEAFSPRKTSTCASAPTSPRSTSPRAKSRWPMARCCRWTGLAFATGAGRAARNPEAPTCPASACCAS